MTQRHNDTTTQRHKHADEIIAWAEGAEIEFKGQATDDWMKTGTPSWYENYEYRVKPPAKKYRVALFKYPGVEAVVSVANSKEDAERYEENIHFVRWLTDWVEYEEK